MKRLIKIAVFLSLSLLIHLGLSHLFDGSKASRRVFAPVQVSLISQKTPEKPQIPDKPKERPKPKPKPAPAPVQEPEPQDPPDIVEEEIEPAPEIEEHEVAEQSEDVSAVDSRMAAEIYERQVLEIIRRNLRYPSNARRRGIEGTVMIRFTIQSTGRVTDIRVVQSSGASLLDKVSLATIGKCSFPPPPRDSMHLSVPITFRLTGEM